MYNRGIIKGKRTLYNVTLSKILCKWKQDSVISFSLYLDSVFKHKHKFVHNQSPVWNRHCPFLFNLHKWKIHGLFYGIVRREWKLWFCVLSDFPIQVFNEICGIDYFSDFQRELEENSQVIPVIFPGQYGIRIFSCPFLFQIVKFRDSNLLIGRVIDCLLYTSDAADD